MDMANRIGHVFRRRCSRVALAIAIAFSSAVLLVGCTGSASDYVKEGSVYLEKGDLTAAVISFKNAVQADPKSLPARMALADALERSGDLQAAEQQYRRAIDSGGDADDLMPRIGVLLLDRAENALLVRDFGTRVLKSSTADSDMKALVALAYLAQGQTKQASEQLGKAKEQTAAVHLAKAQTAFMDKHRQEAADEMDTVLKADTIPWWVARAASRVYQANGEALKALEAIKRSYDLAPMHRGVVGEYAEQLLAANRKEEARPLRDKLHKLAPGYYRTQYLDALFLMEDGKHDLAYTAATRVLAVLPVHRPSQIIAATVELERNELSTVETRVNKILSADPDSIEGLRLRANLEMRRGNFTAATAALDKAISRAPEDRNLLALASGVSWSRGDKPKALSQLKQAATQYPPHADMLARLAEMQQATGQHDEALKTLDSSIGVAKDSREREVVFNAAVRLKQYDKAKTMAQNEIKQRPKDPAPLLWMAAVVGSEGNDAEALEYTKRALDLRPDYYPALNALAKTANKSERAREYELRLQKAVESGTAEPRVYIDRARQMAAANAGSEKIGELLDKGVAATRTDVPLREVAISHWMSLGRKDKALALAREGEAALPDNGAMTALAASVQELAGESVQAGIKYGQLADRFPDRVDWNLKHAQNLVRDGKKDDAIKVLRRLINLRPEEPIPYEVLAKMQVDQGLVNEAQLTAEMLRDKPRMKAAGLLLLGDVYANTDRRAEAIKTYGAAADAGAAEVALLRKVNLLDQTGSGSMAASELNKWLAAHPENVAGLALAARRASDRADYPNAAKYLETIVRQNPKNPVALNDLAWAYVMAKDSRALAVANKGAELAPKNSAILDTLSQAQLNAGQKKEAMDTLRRALAIDPKAPSPFVRLHLAELVIESGEKKEAGTLLAGLEDKDLDKEARQRFKLLKEKL
jgi:cellulose synthase operon protein C